VTDTSPERRIRELEAEVRDLRERIELLRSTDLERWAATVAEARQAHADYAAMKTTVSWRITAPLRVFRTRQLRG
jgi:hypothetical protein